MPTDAIGQRAANPDLGPICRLADQLDAALAMGEDLLCRKADATLPAGSDATQQIALRHQLIADFARATLALELAMTARLMQARARAIDVRDVHPQFAPLIGLFIGGTAILADAAAGLDGGLGDISATALATGPDVLQFFVSRSVVDRSVRSLAAIGVLAVGEDYLLAARIPLGTLMDMLAQFVDALDLAFDLYADPRPVEPAT